MLVELLHQLGLVGGDDGRELGGLLGQQGIDLEGLPRVEGLVLGVVPASPEAHAAGAHRGPEVGAAVALGQSEVDLLVDPGVDDVGVLEEDGQAGPAGVDRGGQALGQLLPGLAAVGRLVEVVAGLAVDVGPGPAVELVGLGDDDVEIARVDDEFSDAAVGEGPAPLPGLAAVGRHVEAALGVRLVVVELALGGDVGDVRVLGIDLDLGNEVALGEPDVGPGLAGVDRLPDAVAVGARAGVHRLARPQVEDLGIGRGDAQRAHAHVAVLVENGLEVRAGVLGLPHPAARGEDVVGRGLSGGHGELGDPAREVDGPDPAPGQQIEIVGRDLRLGRDRPPGAQDEAQGQKDRERTGETGRHRFPSCGFLSGRNGHVAFKTTGGRRFFHREGQSIRKCGRS